MAFRLLWWLEEGCLDLLISKALVETPLCLSTALHCATEMSPCAEYRLLVPFGCAIPALCTLFSVPIKAVWDGRQFLWLQAVVSPRMLRAAAPRARRIMRS